MVFIRDAQGSFLSTGRGNIKDVSGGVGPGQARRHNFFSDFSAG